MTKEQFLIVVEEVIGAHPDWAVDLDEAARRGLLDRLHQEQERACDMETVAVVALSKRFKNKDNELARNKLEKHKDHLNYRWDWFLEGGSR